MKTFWKVFAVSFFFFLFAIILGSYSYIANEGDIDYDSNMTIISEVEEDEEYKEEDIQEEKENTIEEKKTYKSLEEAFKESNRVNVVIMGMEDSRTDAIVFVSFDPDNKEANCISIPRDTYIHRKGYNSAEQRKINSVYESHGENGVKKTVSYIMQQAPVHNYIEVNYEGVEKIVDSVGGVEVLVPFHMKYSDPTADPPLEIDLKPGKQVLNGKESLEFLRYRKGYIDGDLGRIQAQQDYFSSFAKKVMSYRLPTLIRDAYKYVETDMSLFEALDYGRKALGINMENISFTTLSGSPEYRRYGGKLLSYFIFNPTEVKSSLEDIYNVKPPSGG